MKLRFMGVKVLYGRIIAERCGLRPAAGIQVRTNEKATAAGRGQGLGKLETV